MVRLRITHMLSLPQGGGVSLFADMNAHLEGPTGYKLQATGRNFKVETENKAQR